MVNFCKTFDALRKIWDFLESFDFFFKFEKYEYMAISKS